AYELVGEGGLAGAAGAGDAEDGDLAQVGRLADLGQRGLVEPAGLGTGDGPGDGEPVAREHLLDTDGPVVPEVEVAVGDDRVDHADQPELLTVLGGEDVHPGLAQSRDLLGHDHPATAADDLDV